MTPPPRPARDLLSRRTAALLPALLAAVAVSTGCGQSATPPADGGGTDAGGAMPDAGLPACAGAPGPWETVAVPGAADGPVSLALAADDSPAVLYQAPADSGTGEQLDLARESGASTFTTAKVALTEATADNLFDPTLASDSTGALYAAFGYFHTMGPQGVVFANLDGTPATEPISLSGPSHIDLGFAPDATARVAYTDAGSLDFAKSAGTSFMNTIVDTGTVPGETRSAGVGVALFVDAAGTDHMSYATFSDGGVWYANDAGGSFTIAQVASNGYDEQRTAIVVEADGTVHVFYRSGDGHLEHALRGSDGTFSVETVDASPTGGEGVVAAIDAGGTLHALEYDEGCPAVRHAWYASGAWHLEAVAGGGSTDIDLVADSAGGLYAAWRDGGTVFVGHRMP